MPNISAATVTERHQTDRSIAKKTTIVCRKLQTELFDRRKLYAAGEYLHRKREIIILGEGGRDTQVAVAGVDAVGEGGADGGEGDADILAELVSTLGAAVGQVETDEVTAAGH